MTVLRPAARVAAVGLSLFAPAAGAGLLANVLAAPLVAQDIPTPESVLGHGVGADFHLATYEESIAYFERLAAASDRVELREVGRTSFGRPAYIALISSAANLADLDRLRDTWQALAHPRDLDDAEARRLASEGKALVWIDGGLHATEVAHAQHTIQLAYDLVTGDDDPEIARILDEVVLLLWPSINPDGQTLVAEWYRGNVGTPYEVAPTPFLYQKYIGHDNNRDGYMLNQRESRYVTRVAREWEPQVLYNHHQSAPFPTRIWIPPFAEPISPHVHPLMWRTVNLMGMAMSAALEERGQRGATHMGTGFDNWYPGFMDHANNFHNVASFLTETALYRYATPGFYTIDDFPSGTRDLRPESLYSSPWEGGWWRLRDAVDYMLTASISVLDFAAKYRADLLYNRYQAGRDVIARYESGPPYAYFIPMNDQRDPVAAAELLRRLAYNGIEIDQTVGAAVHDGIELPLHTYVIRMNQEFGNYVRQLFERQEYPDLRAYPEGPPDQPYDVSGWTLPLQMGVRVIEASSPLGDEVLGAMMSVGVDPLPWDAEVEDASPWDSPIGVGFDSHPVAAGIVPPGGSVTGGGPALVVDPAENNAFRALNRAWAAGARVGFVPGAPGPDGGPGTSGRYTIDGLRSDDELVEELRLRATRGSSGIEVAQPRIGLYRPFSPSMDEGWTRWLLERFGFEFASLGNPEVHAGELRRRYDVIILADMSSRQILEGFPKGSVPPRYEGGLGEMGVRELDRFVREGGTLVCLNGSAGFAIDRLHLPVRDVTRELDRAEYFQSGSIVEMIVDPSHPVMSGMPERALAVVEGSPVFTTGEDFEGAVLARYPDEGSPLVSGYLLGPEHIRGYASALEARHGDGRVILLGMRPQWRGQPFGNFRILFNAALYSTAVAASAPANPVFWTPPDAAESEEDDGGRERP